jgi:hypothetical protein
LHICDYSHVSRFGRGPYNHGGRASLCCRAFPVASSYALAWPESRHNLLLRSRTKPTQTVNHLLKAM